MDNILTWISFLVLLASQAHTRVVSDASERHYHPHASGSRAQPKAADDVDWKDRGQADLLATINRVQKLKAAKNVILFIGDGMGISTLTASRFYKAQTTSTPIQDTKLAWEAMPYTGLIQTYNTDQQTADSAGTATAFLAGEKTRAGIIGLNQNVPRGNCTMAVGNEVKSMLTYGEEEGKLAGIVSTARITHATPACAYAHSPDRDYENDADITAAGYDPDTCWDIARQLVHSEDNKDIRVILGGGRRHFLPNTTADPEYPASNGERHDGRNLMNEWADVKREMGVVEDKFAVVQKRSEFNNVDENNVDYLMGLFEYSHMKYEADRRDELETDEWAEPSLAEMVRKAISILKKGPNGYILLVESGRIDHAHHDNNAHRALMDTLALDEAVQTAMDLTLEEETLLIVTADHSHVFTMGGYQGLNNDILGIVVDPDGDMSFADDDKPWLTLSYSNGPGFKNHRTVNGDLKNETSRLNLTGLDAQVLTRDFLQDSLFPLYSETHGGEDVAVYASGPMAHLFVGQHEQSYIAHAAMYTACVGWNKDLCEVGISPPGCETSGAGRATGAWALGLVAVVVALWR